MDGDEEDPQPLPGRDYTRFTSYGTADHVVIYDEGNPLAYMQAHRRGVYDLERMR